MARHLRREWVGIERLPNGEEPTNHLYSNNRDGTFADVTEKAGLVRHGWRQGVCAGDYDNDGNPDLFLLRQERALSQRRQRYVHRCQARGRPSADQRPLEHWRCLR